MARKKQPLPHYRNTYPDSLATQEELKLEGLKPGRPEPAALLEYERGDISGLCGLHERAEAVPLDQPSPAPRTDQ
ncbi:hypothetical protein [Deinococcus apachensis]|uniref:hypothetical protein n=1 Tax=Deinococcus apachensis TaxID=309886 RepID=UPI0003608DAD|nr:hypothetical protein [Deinococcus apachensis]